MNRSRSTTTSAADEDAALVEVSSILPAGDRLRFAALGRVSLFSAAKQKSLLRQEKALVSRVGPDAPEVRATRRRLEDEKQFEVAVTVEAQRTQATTIVRNPEALTLHGRVVNPQRLAVPGLTVSATDATGKSVVFTSTDDTGYFSLLVPASAETTNESVTLLVSDRKKAVFFRGTESFAREPGKIYYRELVTGTTDPKQPPTPPPDIDPESITVPDVQGLREDVASAQLRAVGLAVKSSTKVSTVENAGRVLEQGPKPGVKVVPGSSVAIVVGAAPATVEVPNVVGLTVEGGKAALEKLNLTLGTLTPAGASSQARIVQQSPAAGTLVAPQTPVDLVVRESSPGVAVPNIIEASLPAARTMIATAGLVLGKIDPSDAPAESIVVVQTPLSGAKVKPGSAVNVGVRAQSPKIAVPSLVRLQLPVARLALEKAGLKTGKLNPPNSPDQSVVIRQSPAAGTSVEPNSAVDLTLKGPAIVAGSPSLTTATKVVRTKKATRAPTKATKAISRAKKADKK